ncbi:pectinesterase 2-like [Ipomoea triloba]|uniref:pectinesterase 2-like n=1 Tax=Ipomoea triloba TaxID=35885 RepID=UPI00125D7A70|nr:pectinesterase 2-like [Ipomoea triloba]
MSQVDSFPEWVTQGARQLLQSSTDPSKANIIVAKDGSGHFKTLREGVNASHAGNHSNKFIIYIKEGVYDETVKMSGERFDHIMLLGDGILKTIITGNRSVGGGIETFNTSTFAVEAFGFMAKGITFRNTAGPENYQALALGCSSREVVLYQCSFEGYQDTLYLGVGRQFIRECDIYGTVDFIFGYGTTVVQNSNIYVRNPPKKVNVITAHHEEKPYSPGGFSFQNCTIRAARELVGSLDTVKTYLGRPWGRYAITVFMECYMDALIDPAGWTPWDNTNQGLDTLYYGEYENTGPGAQTANRVRWPGYHAITSPGEAAKFTVDNFIHGNEWLPELNERSAFRHEGDAGGGREWAVPVMRAGAEEEEDILTLFASAFHALQPLQVPGFRKGTCVCYFLSKE